MQWDKEYQTVILAALLHDIGKFIQRGSFALNVEGKHPEVSGEKGTNPRKGIEEHLASVECLLLSRELDMRSC